MVNNIGTDQRANQPINTLIVFYVGPANNHYPSKRKEDVTVQKERLHRHLLHLARDIFALGDLGHEVFLVSATRATAGDKGR